MKHMNLAQTHLEEMGIVPGGGSVLLYLSGQKFIETVQKVRGGHEFGRWLGYGSNGWDYESYGKLRERICRNLYGMLFMWIHK